MYLDDLLSLLGQHHLDELLVVNVALAVLLAVDQGLNLLSFYLVTVDIFVSSPPPHSSSPPAQ